MFRFLVGRIVAAMVATMRKRYNYDGSYLEEVASVSGGGAVRLMLLPLFSQYRAGASVDLWAGAAAGSTRDGDCGPCLQLVVDMALESGADAQRLHAALAQQFDAAGDTGLGYRFAQAVIHDGAELQEVRNEIQHRFGEQALVSLSITAATARSWPVIKRGLGHGQACQAVIVDEQRLALAEYVDDSDAAANTANIVNRTTVTNVTTTTASV